MSDETVYKAQRGELSRRTPNSALIVIGAGGALLLATLLGVNLWGLLWPLIFVVGGATLLWPAWKSTPESQSTLAYFAVPGAFFAVLGGLFFVMNLLGHWESMAYAWFLLPASAVWGLIYVKRFDKASSVHRWGNTLLRVLVTLTLAFSLVFELLVYRTFGPWWPVAVIVFGIYLFAKHQRSKA